MKILRNWKVIVAVALIFVAGGVTGAALTVVHFKHAFERGLKVDNWTSGTMDHIQKELKLTPEQEPKVRAIVQETGSQFKQNFGQAIRISGTNLVESWRRIDQVLTPAQHTIHQRECDEFREKLKKGLEIELPPDTVAKGQ